MVLLKQGQKVFDVKGNTYLIESGDYLTEQNIKESEEVTFSEYENKRNGFKILDMYVDGEKVCTLTYSENPNIGYTQDKNSEDFLYIEMVETPNQYRRKGYARTTAIELANRHPDKVLIGSMNQMSKNALSGVVKEVH